MDRRNFVKAAMAGAALAALPKAALSALSGLSDMEIEDKVKELLGRLTLEEKVSMMSGVLGKTLTELATALFRPGQGHGYTGYTVGIERLGIPQIKCLDGPRGVGFRYKTTCFPVGMMRGATWDPELEEKVGDAMGRETRALGANMLLAPCINLLWHPRWGRAQETYGEDQHHLGVMGAAFTRGVQKHVMACPKHYAVNNIEDHRFDLDAVVDERTLREVFLPHFKKCVEAKAATVMSAYNYLNGYKAGQNRRVMRDILNDEWGFDGFVVSDWENAMDDTVEAAEAGLDLEMPRAKYYGDKLLEAVRSGKVSEERVNDSVGRMLRQIFRFVGPDFEEGYSQEMIASREHTGLALEVARKGIVLLKNDAGMLPLQNVKSLAVLGKRAMENNLGDLGSSVVTPPYKVTILDAIKKHAAGAKVSYCSGFPPRSRALAEKADAVVVVAGLNYQDEGEGHDRESMTLAKDQIELIKTAAAVNDKVAVVLVGGSAITMSEWKDEVEAILMSWYPGMEGGNAVAEVLFGKTNPSGRLPIVFPKNEAQLMPFENQSLSVKYEGNHGYRLFDEKNLEPEFPFGFGLSYAAFKYDNAALGKASATAGDVVRASVEVSNVGERAGEEVVQLYVGYEGSEVTRPLRELKAFTRVSLAPGETKTVELTFPADDLAYYHVEDKKWVLEKIAYPVLMGPSSDKNTLLLAGRLTVS